MSGERSDKLITDYYHLQPGETAEVITESGALYQIEPSLAEGAVELQSKVTRKPPVERKGVNGDRIFEGASVGEKHKPHVGTVVIGKSLEIIGIEQPGGERVDLMTTPVIAVHIQA